MANTGFCIPNRPISTHHPEKSPTFLPSAGGAKSSLENLFHAVNEILAALRDYCKGVCARLLFAPIICERKLRHIGFCLLHFRSLPCNILPYFLSCTFPKIL